jgi:hypothetical protein
MYFSLPPHPLYTWHLVFQITSRWLYWTVFLDRGSFSLSTFSLCLLGSNMEHFGHKLAGQSESLVFKGPDLFLVALISKKIRKSASRTKGVGFLRCYKTTFPKFWRFSYPWTDILQFCETHSETTLHLLESGWYDFLTTPNPCKWETDSHNGNEKHSNEIWWWWAYSLAFRSVYEMVDETQKPRNRKRGILANSSVFP